MDKEAPPREPDVIQSAALAIWQEAYRAAMSKGEWTGRTGLDQPIILAAITAATRTLEAEVARLTAAMADYDHAAKAPDDTPAMRALRYDYEAADVEVQVLKRTMAGKMQAAERGEYGALKRLEAAKARATAAEAKLREAREVLFHVAQQFRYYERSHAAKGTPDADCKALVNRRYAEMCEAASPKEPSDEA